MPSDSTDENDISGTIPEKIDENQDAIIIRKTKHEADVHFKNVWESQYNEKKIGVESDRELAYVFQEILDWEKSHHRWSSDRVEDTDMWEVDLDALFYVACTFMKEGVEVTVSDEVWDEFVQLRDS